MKTSTAPSLRAERAEAVRLLREEGLKLREIAERTGLSYSYVHELVNDPEGRAVAARKASYVKPCPECGRPASSSGSDGKDTLPRLCLSCEHKRVHDDRYWTAERIIEWIQGYVAKHGAVPPASLLVTRETGFGTETIRREFGPGARGGWRAAVRAAGFTPLKDSDNFVGPLGKDHPTIQERLRLHAEGLSCEEIAQRQGVSHQAIRFTIRRYVEGKEPMGTRLSATAVLEREKERAELRLAALREEAENVEQDLAGLIAALEALANAHRNGHGK